MKLDVWGTGFSASARSEGIIRKGRAESEVSALQRESTAMASRARLLQHQAKTNHSKILLVSTSPIGGIFSHGQLTHM